MQHKSVVIDMCTQIWCIQVGSEFLVERAVLGYSMNPLDQHAVRVREVKGMSSSIGVKRGSGLVKCLSVIGTGMLKI